MRLKAVAWVVAKADLGERCPDTRIFHYRGLGNLFKAVLYPTSPDKTWGPEIQPYIYIYPII